MWYTKHNYLASKDTTTRTVLTVEITPNIQKAHSTTVYICRELSQWNAFQIREKWKEQENKKSLHSPT
jgi:hypothetical protein